MHLLRQLRLSASSHYNNLNAPVRTEIEAEFRKPLADLQFQGEGYRDGKVYQSFGIAFVPDPYGKIEPEK